MMCEPEATAQTRQVRVVANMLTKDAFLPSSVVCVISRRQANRGFAQRTLFNVESHDIVGEL